MLQVLCRHGDVAKCHSIDIGTVFEGVAKCHNSIGIVFEGVAEGHVLIWHAF